MASNYYPEAVKNIKLRLISRLKLSVVANLLKNCKEN